MRQAFLALILCTVATGAQERKVDGNYAKDGVIWASSMWAGYKEASLRQVPVLLAIHKDGSEGCLKMQSSTYTDRKYIEASRSWVNIALHAQGGHEVEATVAGKKVTVCNRYWNIPCSAHVISDQTLRKYLKDLPEAPAVVFFWPSRIKELGREVGVKTASELIKAQDAILKEFPGSKVPLVEWNKAMKIMGEGDAHFAKQQWVKAYKTYSRVYEKPIRPTDHHEALVLLRASGLKKVDDVANERIFEVLQLVRKDRSAAYKMAKKVIADFEGLPVLNAFG
jgi:hypothetical protein